MVWRLYYGGTDMVLLEVLQYLVSFLKEKPTAQEYSVETTDNYCVNLFWHEPSLNLNWYPILQIENDGREVFWGEGTENPDCWYKLAINAIEKLCK